MRKSKKITQFYLDFKKPKYINKPLQNIDPKQRLVILGILAGLSWRQVMESMHTTERFISKAKKRFYEEYNNNDIHFLNK